MEDKKDFVKKVWGFVLGDGNLKKLSKKYYIHNSLYRLSQAETHKDYVEYQADILENLTRVRVSLDEPRGLGKLPMYRLETMQHPLYTKMRKRIYPQGVKIIDPHHLKLLDWEVVSYLYMDDGNLAPANKNGRKRASIATYNFSYGDNMLLREAIKEKLGVVFNVHRMRQYFKLTASANNTETFIKGIEPYILPSFEYKLNLSYNE